MFVSARSLCLQIAIVACSLSFVRPGRLVITDLKCISHNEEYLTIRRCELTPLTRKDQMAINGYMENKKKDLSNLMYKIVFSRKFDNYRPFLNLSGDVCDLSKTVKTNFFIGLIKEAFGSFADLLHECPFNEDIEIKDMILNESFLTKLPLPGGQFGMIGKLYHFKTLLLEVIGYATIKELI